MVSSIYNEYLLRKNNKNYMNKSREYLQNNIMHI